jgi:hypothetical protein
LFKVIRYSSIGVFCVGIFSVIQACTAKEGALLAALLVLLNFCTGAQIEEATETPNPIQTVTVSSSNMQGWAAGPESGSPPAGGLVSGPGTPPLGSGSAYLPTDDSTDGHALGVAETDLVFSKIKTLKYSTYLDSSSTCTIQRIALQFNVDADVTDGDFSWQGRLVFEPANTPAYSGILATDVWQEWDTLQGNWWATGNPIKVSCSQGAPCTWGQILTLFPNVGIHPTLGAIILKAGSGWNCIHNGYVDGVIIVLDDGTGVTINFEP